LSSPDLAAAASRSYPTTPLLSTESEEWPIPAPLDRTGESEETLRARLVYQSRKRGTLETDLILATFARDHLRTMNVQELRQFDKLMDEPDWDIYYWSVGKKEPPMQWKGTPLLNKLIQHVKNEGKEVRMMPALAQHAAGR
ncbi:succinate dehydrogenase assembly factor 2, partial [Tremellales sp. Uapishka_1]